MFICALVFSSARTKDGIIAEIRKIFNFENENYLEELQKKAERDTANIGARRSVFIIDALNEGLDDQYWCESLGTLKIEFDKYSHLSLLVTVRKPFHEKYRVEQVELSDAASSRAGEQSERCE